MCGRGSNGLCAIGGVISLSGRTITLPCNGFRIGRRSRGNKARKLLQILTRNAHLIGIDQAGRPHGCCNGLRIMDQRQNHFFFSGGWHQGHGMLKISRRDHRQIADRINRCTVRGGEQMDFDTIIASNSIGEG